MSDALRTSDLSKRFRATPVLSRLNLAVPEGSVYALTMPSNVDYLATYLGLAKLGAVAAGINPRLAGPERDAILSHLRPGTVVDGPERPQERLPAGRDLQRNPIDGT